MDLDVIVSKCMAERKGFVLAVISTKLKHTTKYPPSPLIPY